MTEKHIADLRIACLQAPLFWEDVPANLNRFAGMIQQIQPPCDLILLPEMFTTGFSMHPAKLAEGENGPTRIWMHQMASQTGSVIAGTYTAQENGKYYNRFLWVYPDGSSGHYDKRHLFRMGLEGEHFSKGSSRETFCVNGWSIMPLTCYDLRFPVWSMNSFENERHRYDLLVYLANWPAPRRQHWMKLLMARAIENQAFVAGVNRTCTDGNGIAHVGLTMVVDAYGIPVSEAGEADEKILQATLDRKGLDDYRARFPVAYDWASQHLSNPI
jgi:omega-amidase